MKSWFDRWSGALKLTFDQLTVHRNDRVAFSHGSMHMTGPIWCTTTVLGTNAQ